MNSKHQQGFTLIELLVVAVIVGILATLVAMTYSGVQAKNRNSERQASINFTQSQLETYYAENSKYPSLSQLNDPAWREANLKKLKDDAIKDPRWDKDGACSKDNKARFADTPTEKCYSYQVTTTDAAFCDNEKNACVQYTLTASFEGGEKYVKTSLN